MTDPLPLPTDPPPEPRVLSLRPLDLCDGNPFAVIAYVSEGLRISGATKEERKAFQAECMSGDYDHLLLTAMRHTDMRAEPGDFERQQRDRFQARDAEALALADEVGG